MSVEGIGTDVVDINRFRLVVEERGDGFLRRIFTDEEIKYAENKKFFHAHMAGKFAAKEAVKKALPDGARIGLNWTEIEILNHPDGKPYVRLYGRARQIMEDFNLTRVLVSVSHTDDVATSNAMAVKND
jgi:holo-[acyl-carrier protein] synthase